MCGIAGLLSRTVSSEALRARMQGAIEALRHRGPDAQAILSFGHACLGHTRLAIVDLVGGEQPKSDPTGRWTITFNGEIYNYRELRGALSDRWKFRDASDTEVLLAGLVLEGAGYIRHLDGMWAFALHDSLDGSLLLSRDGFGKKPLFFARHGTDFACASELAALRHLLPDMAWREDPASISDYLRQGYAMPGETCIEGVKEVLPGHWMRVEADGSAHSQRYWNPDTSPWQGTRAEALHHVAELLEAAVAKRQLAADVEVGAFLSGGIDSTAVCALAQARSGNALRTFTAGFDEPTYDERGYAARAAAWIGTSHVAETLRADEAVELASRTHYLMGQPFGDASIIPSAMVAAVASRDVKVVLTGDGGDEVFGGYARYIGRLMRQRYLRVPSPLRRGVEFLLRQTREPIAHHSGSFLKRAHLFVAMSGEKQAYVAPPAMRQRMLEQLAPSLGHGRQVTASPWEPRLGADEIEHMLRMDWLVWLPQDILAKVDRATMSASLEARSPFLDRDLVEFVLRLPWQWHFGGMRGKRLLREAIGERIPDFVWRRRKQGFASPVSHWMRGSLGDSLQALSAEDIGCLERHVLQRWLREHRNGGVDHGQALWIAYSYLQWRATLATP